MLVLLIAAACSAALPGAASALQPALASRNVVIDPGPNIVGLDGLSIARDGSGGLVYVKDVAGVAHVFVSKLVGGVFASPQQVDAGLAGPSSQPVIAAGADGLLLAAFINGGTLYVVESPGSGLGFTAPAPLIGGAADPAISISNAGKAYLAFNVLGAGGHDVRAAYFVGGRWALESAPLDADPADDAGAGAGSPSVTSAGDGVGIVAWGEAGHVYSRRVWATAPSVVFEQADMPSLGGWSEVSADQASIGAGGDSSYATVAFHETFSNGSATQSRVLSRRLHGSQFDGLNQPDGLTTPGGDGAREPGIAVTEYGRGFVTSTRLQSNQLVAAPLGTNDVLGPSAGVNTIANAADPHAVAAVAGLFSTLVAWQQSPGTAGPAEIRARYAQQNSALGAEFVASDPSLGPTNAADGLVAGGDVAGNAAIAWAQGTAGSEAIVAARLFKPPGAFSPSKSFRYATSANPLLSWSASSELWGAVRYVVTVDGTDIAQSTGTRVRFPTALADGPHTWQVTAFNAGNASTAAETAKVWIDTVAPKVSLKLTGIHRVGAVLHASVFYTDSPPPEPRTDASGVASAQLKWGDGTSSKISHNKAHAYARPGRYTVTVIVADRAGNKTKVTSSIRIAPKPKPKPKPPKHKHKKGKK
jgi:PKD domain